MPSSEEVNRQIRASLGLPEKPEKHPTVPVEGHASEFPIYSFSKKRSTVTRLDIRYDDGSFCSIVAPLGMPGPVFPGYLDSIFFYGQHDLFSQSYVEISIYRILQTLGMDPRNGQLYQHFTRDMERSFALFVKTDRFRNPVTGERTHIEYFRILERMKLAKRRESVSQFHFNEIFLQSLRSGYLKRLDFDFCLYLDRQGEALARFLYGHLSKRIGEKSVYMRNLSGFLSDVGLGYLSGLQVKNRNQKIKQVLFPALRFLEGKAFAQWEIDSKGNIFFVS